MKATIKILFFFLLYFTPISYAVHDTLKLELLQVLFRHGDRVPQKSEIYQLDPYYPEKYESIGFGQLTEIGQLRMYEIGQKLRQKYGSFLGSYRFNKVHAYSSNFDRAKISLQAVLAGLYPSNNSCSTDAVRWLPVPTYYDEEENNFLVNSFFSKFCPKFIQLVEEASKSSEILTKLEKYHKFVTYLKNSTGISGVFGLGEFVKLYNNIRSVISMKLPLPNWCTEDTFKNIENATSILFDVLSFSEHLRRINAGPIIEKFIENIEKSTEKIDGGKKIYLYSGHDHNVAAFTKAHNFTNIPGIPDYGSSVIIEKLKGKDDQVYLRMFYWTGTAEEIPLKLEGTDYDIPMNVYKDVVKNILPRAYDCSYCDN